MFKSPLTKSFLKPTETNIPGKNIVWSMRVNKIWEKLFLKSCSRLSSYLAQQTVNFLVAGLQTTAALGKAFQVEGDGGSSGGGGGCSSHFNFLQHNQYWIGSDLYSIDNDVACIVSYDVAYVVAFEFLELECVFMQPYPAART